jgi:glycosyltransferase involved in cell wall biosynthesis
MPVYNGERFLAGTLDSILAQSFRDFELIISDNGSTDGTARICRDYTARDSRIRYFRHDVNRGAAWNHNYVLGLAQGEFFKWNAYDDSIAPAFLEKCVSVLDQTPEAVLCFSKYVEVDANGEHSSNRSALGMWLPHPHERFRQLIYPHSDCVEVYGLMRLAVLRQTPGIAPYTASDKALIVELALRGAFVDVPEVLFFHGCHGANLVAKYPDARDQYVWFDPNAQGRMLFPRSRLLMEYLQSLHRVPLPWKERMLCYGHLLLRMLRHPRALLLWDFFNPRRGRSLLPS